MEKETLNKWADLLLDTGKRNNLVSFKNTNLGTAEIVAPDICTFFSQTEHNSDFKVYDPFVDEEEDDDGVSDNTIVIPDDNNNLLSKEQYIKKYGEKLGKNKLLVYSPINKPRQALSNLCKKSKSVIEETGVNILHIAFGFINWTEDANSNIILKAPILLMPAVIENASVLDPYTITVSHDEITVNPTFAYKIWNDFGIKLPEIEEDDDLESYFSRIEKLIEKLKWTVSRECKIGLFSFLKINMYRDIKENSESIATSPTIKEMTGECDTERKNYSLDFADEPNKSLSGLIELHNVVDADSSQMEAIEMAKKGKSFVLQGPPGTGKSQTITNIIAECLADGKTVLFVSEKSAALSVVYDKLKNVGLEEFCLELHSHKANKKLFIEELCRTLKKDKHSLSNRAGKELAERKQAQQALNAYAEELHKIRPVINKTLYRLYEDISGCKGIPDCDFPIADIETKGEDYIEKATTVLSRFSRYIPYIGIDYHLNAWYGFEFQDISYHSKAALKNVLQKVNQFMLTLQNISDMMYREFGIKSKNCEDMQSYADFFGFVKDCLFICSPLLECSDLDSIIGKVTELKELAVIINEKRRVLDEMFCAEVYKIDGETLYRQLLAHTSIFSRIFNKEYKQTATVIRATVKNAGKIKYQDALKYMDELRILQSKLYEYDSVYSDISKYLVTGYNGVDTDFDKLLSELYRLKDFKAYDLGKLPNFGSDEYTALTANFVEAFDEINKAFTVAGDCVDELSRNVNLEIINPKTTEFSVLAKKTATCLETFDGIEYWFEFLGYLKELQEFGLNEFLDYVIDKNIEASTISDVFKKCFCSQWVDKIIHETPILMELKRIPHDETVRLFKEKDELNFEINKAGIRAVVSSKRPSLNLVAQGSAVSMLIREGEKKRKQRNIRQLFAEMGSLILTIKPCFLMSPLSVSTFLSSDIRFDTVVFDEASQIYPQDAIGAVYRGKQIIVVGDTKQMPPSNFFNSISENESDEDDESITDFESILDYCSGTLPQKRLKWHYRSRFEQLIAFSNKNFYDNELITFPATKSNENGIGIDFCFVDGVFDRQSKTNRAEAEYIVNLVFQNFEEHPNRSVGVVAFSVAQQVLIEKLIAKRRQTDLSKEPFFSSDKQEPFFVKNLETVQGDERDTIIFSIAYGKDATGRLLMNFGPLNREGGERRLNVAITRAKYNVKLVASMHYTDIDLSRTGSIGARLLREYLDYAENGEIALKRSLTVPRDTVVDSEFELEVCEFLREKGYTVDTQVGCSSFKIDIALRRPESSDYLLAIECDGASYHSSKNARDRDRLRQSILENMGWRFYRVWSTDWFRNNSVEKENLLKAVETALNSVACVKNTEKKTENISFEEKKQDVGFEFPEYRLHTIPSNRKEYSGKVVELVYSILKTEAPLSEEWLLKRIVHMYGREKVTSVVAGSFESDMRFCSELGIVRKNGFLYLKDEKIPMLRVPDKQSGIKRSIEDIAIEELANGLREILKQNISVEKDGLYRLIVNSLGFMRITEGVLARLDKALDSLKKEIEIEGSFIKLRE